MTEIVRCPYCVSELEFRPMIGHVDGRFICDKCGHTTRPGQVVYECHCQQCLQAGSFSGIAS
jgi:hypothetical protein